MFARRSNPSIDPPILRKSKSYVTGQVAAGLADWVDPRDRSKGIICREMLHFGERAVKLETIDVESYSPLELPGLRFEPPKSQSQRNMALIRWHWDHSQEKLAIAVC